MLFHNQFNLVRAMLVAIFLMVGVGNALGDAPARKIDTTSIFAHAQRTAERGMAFLESDAAKWMKERKCASCHHGIMTVWVLTEAKSQGYAVAAESLQETVKWTKTLLANIDKPRDSRPGWNMVSTPAVYFAVMSKTIPKQDICLQPILPPAQNQL